MADSIEIETGLGRTAHISLREFEECLNMIEALMEEMDGSNKDLIEIHPSSREEHEMLSIIIGFDSIESGCSVAWMYN